MSSAEHRLSSSSNRSELSKFPDFETPINREHLTIYEEDYSQGEVERSNLVAGRVDGLPRSLNSPKWPTRNESFASWTNAKPNGAIRHGRQKSLSDAFKIIRARRGSVSANAQEIAEALKAPVSFKLVALCLVWYFSSALTNASSKSILNAFNKPVTLTVVQFAFVSFWCFFFAWLANIYPPLKTMVPALKHGLRYPTREVIDTTLPLALFQLCGHILSSTATSKIPVSLVHTIKGLSPLFTVLAYRFIFNIRYSPATYMSLIPLTGGVVLACSVEFSGNLFGILYAFIAALIFVSQNIFSKKLFNDAARVEADGATSHHRNLDKLNLLCYCSALAFILTSPIWLWTEGFGLIRDFYDDGSISLSNKPHALDHGRLTLEFLFNGVFHFGQNIIAFVLLSMVSPVTYSVASLIKRVFVIVAAIIWFGDSTTMIQGFGIALTFLGLYLYDRTSDSARNRKANLVSAGSEPSLLPISAERNHLLPSTATNGIRSISSGQKFGGSSGYAIGLDDKKLEGLVSGRPRGSSRADVWLAPGIKQEDTWRSRDMGLTA